MNQRTVTAPHTGFAELAAAYWLASESPIYDAIERQWLQEGREVPRQEGLPRGGRHRSGDGDLFHRA
ncbi:hypothetical protein ACFWUW_17130 [Streptomyces sp. NPDC058655]|uniref:hypothetical protein n=1 Tax=unclassified Streptomyces TaxID=2593676 RepID=UPI003648F0CA